MRTSLAALLVVLLAAAGCSDPRKALEDEAACPGATCTQDARARYDAIARIPRVSTVTTVSRTYGLDRGATSGAEVTARVSTRGEARVVALAALRVLQGWPGHPSSTSEVTVEAEPSRVVDYVSQASLDLSAFPACAPAACAGAVERATQRLRTDVDGLSSVSIVRRGGTLLVAGRAPVDQSALAAGGVRRVFFDLGLRVASRLEVRVSARGPLVLTLRRDGDRVCPQPPGGAVVACDGSNSTPLGAP